MAEKVSFLKYILTCAIGFGIGGAIWGWLNFRGMLGSLAVDYPLNIFSILVVLIGGIGLSIYTKDIKQVLKTIGLGIVGGIIGIFIAFLGIYNLPNIGSFIVFLLPEAAIRLSYLPNLGVAEYWLNFFIAGIFIGLFFALALKIKIWPMVWRGAVGFGLAAIISPIIGNIIGNAFNSLFVSYVLTFALIGVILGKLLGWGVYKNLKP